MSELLNNDEIESLMEMVNSESSEFDGPVFIEDAGTQRSGRTSSVSPIDLLTPNRISTEQLKRFVIMFEDCAKAIGATMSEQLRYPIHCDCVGVDQTRFANWVPVTADDTAIYVLSAPPLDIPIFFSVTNDLLYGWVDRVLGGNGQVEEVPAEFSEAEFAVADGFLGPIFDRLVVAMEGLTKMEISIEDRFTNPSRVHLLPAQDVVLSVHFQAGSELLLGDLRLCIAYSSLLPFIDSLGAGPERFTQAPGSMRHVLAETMQPVDVNVSIELGAAELTLRDLMSLRVGDIVKLDQRAGDPMIAPVEGVPKFAGRVGTVGSRLGFRIESVLE